jgi:hypothetical protein
MKLAALLALSCPALLLASPAAPPSSAPVAVFNFETAPGVDAAFGAAVAGVVRGDLAALPPLRPVSPDLPRGASVPSLAAPPAAAAAAVLGRELHADALVFGRVARTGSTLALSAWVVRAADGSIRQASARGDGSESAAELASRLSLAIAAAVLRQPASAADRLWPSATICGSERAGAGAVLSIRRRSYVSALDGRAIVRDQEGWRLDRPLTPGSHSILASYFDGTAAATCSLYFTARPGAAYVLRSRDSSGNRLLLWISERGSDRPVVVWASPARGAPLQCASYVEVEKRAPVEPVVMESRGFTWVGSSRAVGPFGR